MDPGLDFQSKKNAKKLETEFRGLQDGQGLEPITMQRG